MIKHVHKGITFLLICALFPAYSAVAGEKRSTPVSITTTAGGVTVVGSTLDARESNDAAEYINCYARVTADGSFSFLNCSAKGDNKSAFCLLSSPDEALLRAVGGINRSSVIRFSHTSNSYACTYLEVDNNSRNL